LRCPFGCREHHRRQRCCQRSTAYYQTAAGKAKKKRLNARRQSGPTPPSASPPPDFDPPGGPASDPLPAIVGRQMEGVVLDEPGLSNSPMLPYVRMIVSLIEGVEFSCREILGLLRRTMRQHSIGAGSRNDYLLSFLHQHPP
jgi:hypothetical protein